MTLMFTKSSIIDIRQGLNTSLGNMTGYIDCTIEFKFWFKFWMHKSIDWFLYEGNTEAVEHFFHILLWQEFIE